ncbi:MAG: formylglycine-generating enzyme family protein [Cyanobacteria bacterium P01_F01_bin.143]
MDFQGENNCATVERLNRRLRDRVKEINSVYGKPRQTPRSVIEPASKYHLILLPEYIRPTDQDIAVMKIDALKAERAKNWKLAEALWTRLIRFDQEEALSSLREIWVQSQGQTVERKVEPEPIVEKSGEKSTNDDYVKPEIVIERSQKEPVKKKSSGLSTFEFEVVTVDDYGKENKRETKQAEYFAEDLGNGVTLDMVSIPGGSFWMGTEEEEIAKLRKIYDSDWYKNESPRHKVNLANFFMGRYPITQAQWREIASWEKVRRELNPDPSSFKKDYEGIDRWLRPVEQVSWEDAREFCDRLFQKTGNEYRLPSEAEWEYAARAGTNTPFHFGQTISTEFANYRGTDWEPTFRTFEMGFHGFP